MCSDLLIKLKGQWQHFVVPLPEDVGQSSGHRKSQGWKIHGKEIRNPLEEISPL